MTVAHTTLGSTMKIVLFALGTLFIRGNAQVCLSTLYTDGIVCQNMVLQNGKPLVTETRDTTRVTYIKIASSDVPVVPSGVFVQFPKVKKIDLSSCGVTRIEQGAFSDVAKLEELSFSNNNISELTNGSIILPNLKLLNLAQNRIVNIPNWSLLQLNAMLRLVLHDNMITDVPSRNFETLNKLVVLDLGHNKIKQIEPDSFKGLTGLTTCYLRNNLITQIPFGAFDDFINLEGMYLDYNGLETVGPLFISKSGKMREMDLSHNRITQIDSQAFRGLYGLKLLYLNHNAIQTLPIGAFADLKSLQLLRLWSNSITDFELGTFDGLHNLKRLELENNKIAIIHENSFRGLSELRNLQLHNNELHTFDAKNILSQLPHLDTVYINSNNWNCADLSKILEVFDEQRILVDGGNKVQGANVYGIRCTNSDTFRGNGTDTKNNVTVETDIDSKIDNFINGNNASASLDYLLNGFKETNAYKFFTQDFVNSRFFKYFDSDFKKGEFFKAIHESYNNDTSGNGAQQFEALTDAAQLNGFEIYFAIFIAFGILVLTVSIIILYVIYRSVSRHSCRIHEETNFLVDSELYPIEIV